jgi:glycosyltransferase involved in cell wall biosynthesis
MRILHTAHSYAPEISGVAEVVKQLSVRLALRGHEVHVATKQLGKLSADEILDGVHVHRFDVDGNVVTGMRGAVDSYVRFVRSMTWDVMALHCAQTWTTDVLLPFLHEIPTCKIFVGHGFSALDNPRYKNYFDSLAISLKQVDQILALSNLLEEEPFCTKYGLPAPYVIPNGVDLAEWDAPVHGLRSAWGIGNRSWLLSVSNHSPVKGHPTFFNVVRQVRKELPDALGTIIGGNYAAAQWGIGRWGIKGGCWYRCRGLAAFRSGVALRWNVPRSETVSAIKEADIVLITSWREASPLVVLESMAAGTPWVAFDVGSVREHAGGVVVNSVEDMTMTALELLNNSDRRDKLGQDGRMRVREGHDWEAITTRYEQLYTAAANGRGDEQHGQKP